VKTLNSHHGNPAALVFKCPRPKCQAPPGEMCRGAKHPAVYYATVHKARERLLEMPQTKAEWDERLALVRAAFAVSMSAKGARAAAAPPVQEQMAKITGGC
jgi:hypothetical protein